MININRISDTYRNKLDSKSYKIYYFNMEYEKLWQKIYYHDDLFTTAKICYYEGVPLTRSKKFLEKQFYEDSSLKVIYNFVDGKIRSSDDEVPAIVEYALDGNMCLEVYNEDLDTDVVIKY